MKVFLDESGQTCEKQRGDGKNDHPIEKKIIPSRSVPPKYHGHVGPNVRRVALFIDGMARASILPFVPALAYRLLYNGSTTDSQKVLPQLWPGITSYVSLFVIVFIVGRFIGVCVASNLTLNRTKVPIQVARLGGIALTMQILTIWGAMESISITGFLVARFVSAIGAGMLCEMTREVSLPEDAELTGGNGSHNNHHPMRERAGSMTSEASYGRVGRRSFQVDMSSGSARMYVTGFAISVLTGALIFPSINESTHSGLAQSFLTFPSSWSIIFLVGLSGCLEYVLRSLFSSHESISRRPWMAAKEENTVDAKPSTLEIDFGDFQEDHTGSDDGDTVPFMNSTRFRASSREFMSPNRSRRESHTSVDEFFDCRSMFSDLEEVSFADFGDTPYTLCSKIARYTNNRCVYEDGSAAYVPQGDCSATIPSNYLEFYKGNRSRAQQAWEVSQQWRYEKRVWKIHTLPNPWFTKIKEGYPHFVHGHSKAGYPIVYEQPGKMNLKELFRNGCDVADMVGHYTFFMEYISNCVCNHETIRTKLGPDAPPHNSSSWGIMVVMDVKGAGLSHLSGDVVKYLKQAGDINTAHYPLSMKRAFLVNSPFWLAGAWSGIKGILPESVTVDILSASKYLDQLREYIDDDQIPPEYGGSSPYSLGDHPYEAELRALVERANSRDPEEDDEDNTPPLVVASTDSGNSDRSIQMQDESSGLDPTEDVIQPLVSSPVPLRRRLGSIERRGRRKTGTGFSVPRNAGSVNGDFEVFVLVSGVCSLFSAVQGILEVSMPIWILSTTPLGGLGYSVFRSSVTIFCSCLVLLWVMRRKPSNMLFRIPSDNPMRGFRIGVGSEAVLLAGLASVSSRVSAFERSDSVTVMTSLIIALSCVALASILGRSSSKILHQLSVECVIRRPNQLDFRCSGVRSLFLDGNYGRLTALLCPLSEVIGVIIASPLLSWSLTGTLAAPFDATASLFASSLLCFVLYVCSFSLHLNVKSWSFTSHPGDRCSSMTRHRCVPIIGEAVSVSAGDMASLMEEANWSATPLLGRSRRRTWSEASRMSEMLELGGDSSAHQDGHAKAK